MSEAAHDATVVEESKWGVGVVSAAFVLGGAGLGWLIKAGAGWVADLPWAPLQGPFRLINQVTEAEPISTIVVLVVGALAGGVVAMLAVADLLRVTLTSEGVTLTRGDHRQSLNRSEIGAVFMDGKQLVLVGGAGEELAREQTDLDVARLGEAFRARGYRWSAEDPFATDYRRWVPDTPGLPEGADALLKARQKAMQNGDKDDVTELRSELARLGVVVRDEGKRQFWRLPGR